MHSIIFKFYWYFMILKTKGQINNVILSLSISSKHVWVREFLQLIREHALHIRGSVK